MQFYFPSQILSKSIYLIDNKVHIWIVQGWAVYDNPEEVNESLTREGIEPN